MYPVPGFFLGGVARHVGQIQQVGHGAPGFYGYDTNTDTDRKAMGPPVKR
jgi:hypothetical protein